MNTQTKVTGLSCVVLAGLGLTATGGAAPSRAAAFTSAHRTGFDQASVAVSDGDAVVAGLLAGGRVRVARVGAGGRLFGMRTLARGGHPDAPIVAISRGRVAAAWLDGGGTRVELARFALSGGPVRRDSVRTNGAQFHELAINARGVVVDEFKVDPETDTTGVGGIRAIPGRPAQRFDIAARIPGNSNPATLQVDKQGGFHAAWIVDGDARPLLGRADGDSTGRFAAPAAQDLGSSLQNPVIATAPDGGQLAVYDRYDGQGRILVMTTHRNPDGPWRTPVRRTRLGITFTTMQQVGVTAHGTALIAYGGGNGTGLIRVLIIAPTGRTERTVTVGRGELHAVVPAAGGGLQVVWSVNAYAGAVRTRSFTATGRPLPVQTAVRGCLNFGAPEPLNVAAADTGGRLLLNVVCGERQVESVARVG